MDSLAIEDWNSPTLDLRVFLSDTVAWVKSPSGVEAKVETVPSDPGVAPTYRGYIEFKFEVIEYLKGGGLDDVAVRVSSGFTELTEAEALQTANLMLKRRNTTWEDRESILFLSSSSSQIVPANASDTVSHYSFMEWEYKRYTDYQIGGHAKTWLPTTQEAEAPEQSNTSSASTLFLTDARPAQSDGDLATVSLDEIRSNISKLTETMKAGKGVDGYEYCIHDKLFYISEMRDQDNAIVDIQMVSGLPAGSILGRTGEYWYSGLGYGRRWLGGPDSGLFRIKTVDAEGRTLTDPYFEELITYFAPIISARPLPAGVYRFHRKDQFPEWIPCNFTYPDDKTAATTVTVNLHPNAIHEAFFDPVNLPSGGIGAHADSVVVASASADDGVLKPTSFSAKGIATDLTRIEWRDGRVAIELSPRVDMSGHRMEFIALDGSTALSLDFYETDSSPAGTLSWTVCDRPWSAGDLLMLRISEIGASIGGAADASPSCPPTPTPFPTNAR